MISLLLGLVFGLSTVMLAIVLFCVLAVDAPQENTVGVGEGRD